MPIHSIGKTHSELSNWLIETWLKDGPSVCFIEGFSGVGKTSIARQVAEYSGYDAVIVNMPEANTDQADNLFFDLATELSAIGIDDLATAVTEGKPFDLAFSAVLMRKVIIIIDEFQRSLDETGKPARSILNLVNRLANRLRIPGRVLFLTNRIIERSKWSEAHLIRTLNGLAPSEAKILLDRLLVKAERSAEIPVERRRDVVNWLGGNPRAIQVLVASLERSSLDELIGINPESWEARDRQVSNELLHRLERELLERTMEILTPETAILLRRLSVHRKPVKREAIDILLSDGTEFSTVRDALMTRFLMEQHSGWFSLNPVVREIALQNLKEKVGELRQAHSRAADHYMRHFKAKEIVVDGGKLGGYFVEARYHLVQSQRDKELIKIAGRFENHLKASFLSSSPVPVQLDELNERIATLSALLETPSSKGLEYYLARLYEARHAEGDTQKVLLYAQRATGPHALADVWVLRLRLEAQVNGTEQMLRVAREGIAKVPADKDVRVLYQCAGELLAQAGRRDEAIALLHDGIAKVPVESVGPLYQSVGELLAQAGKTNKAIALLKEGIAKVPADKNVQILYQHAGELLAQAGRRDEAIVLLQEGIAKVPVESVFPLYQSVGELLAQVGRRDEAIALLQEGIAKVPVESVFPLYQSVGGLLAQVGRRDEAIALLQEGIAKVPVDNDVVVLYQSAGELLAQAGKTNKAIALLKDGIAKVPADKNVQVLYQRAGELLAQAGKTNKAIALLKDGIAKVPADKNVRVLYQHAGELLAQVGRRDEAIALLQEGIAKVPVDNDVVVLYQSAGELLAQTGKTNEAIALLKDGMARIPTQYARNRLVTLVEPILYILCAQQKIQDLDYFLAGSGKLAIDPPQLALGHVLRSIISREWDVAARIASQKSLNFPDYRHLRQLEIFCNLCINQVAAADEALQKIDLDKKPNEHLYWLKTWVALKSGLQEVARESLSVYLGRNAEERDVNERYLLQLWDTTPVRGTRFDLAYYFPILPTSLTGLPNDLVRMQYSPSTLAGQPLPQEQAQPSPSQPVQSKSASPTWPVWMNEVLNPSGNKGSVDVGIVIALKEEFEELAPQIRIRPYFNSEIKQYYYLFERQPAHASHAPYRCVVTFMGSMGPTDAGMVGDRLIAQFNPSVILSIGIAGSMDKNVLVGDVVVAEQTDEYLASSKAIETPDKQDWDFQFSGNPYKSDPTYVAHAMHLKYAHSNANANWEQISMQKLLGWLGSDPTNELIRQRLIGKAPGIHTGHIASGPTVGAAKQFIHWLKEKHDRKLLALEMESAGVLNAAHKRAVSSLIIRGISDYSDERKEKSDEIGKGALRRYAMNNALELLWVLMDLGLIDSIN